MSKPLVWVPAGWPGSPSDVPGMAPFASLVSPRPSAPPMPEVHAAALHAVFEASTHPAHRVEPAGCNAPGKGITP